MRLAKLLTDSQIRVLRLAGDTGFCRVEQESPQAVTAVRLCALGLLELHAKETVGMIPNYYTWNKWRPSYRVEAEYRITELGKRALASLPKVLKVAVS